MKTQALDVFLIATLAYAVIYVILGFASSKWIPHYYQVANNPELGGTRYEVISWTLRVLMVAALTAWTAQSAVCIHILGAGWPLIALVAFSIPAYIVLGVLQLLMAWLAYKLNSEFGAIVPEFLIAISMNTYTLFMIVPRLAYPWVWVSGVHH